MGFNKRFISKESIKSMTNCNNHETFFKYFKSDAILSADEFSLSILKRIQKCTIDDKNEIMNIMNDCK